MDYRSKISRRQLIQIVGIAGLGGYGTTCTNAKQSINSTEETVSEGFEKDNLDSWSGIQSAETTTAEAHSGNRSLVITDQYGQDDDRQGNKISQRFSSITPSELTAAMRIDDGTWNSVITKWKDSADDGLTVRLDNANWNHGNSGIHVNNKYIGEVESGVWYQIDLIDIQWRENIITRVDVNDETVAENIELESLPAAISETVLYVHDGGTGSQGWFDDITLGAKIEPSDNNNTAVSQSGEADHWPMFQYDQKNTGVNTNIVGPTEGVRGGWTFDSGRDRATRAVADSDTLYVAVGTNRSEDVQGKVLAISKDEGTLTWEETLDRPIGVSPAVVDGIVFIGTHAQEDSYHSPRDGRLYAFDAATGEEQWEFDPIGGVSGSPTVSDGTVYFGTKGDDSGILRGTAYAVDASNGQKLWSTELGWGTFSAPAVNEDYVYIESRDKNHPFYALDRTDGSTVWEYQPPDFKGNATVANGTVYITGFREDAQVIALDSQSGTEQWTIELQTEVKTSPVVSQNRVYFGTVEGTVYALDPGSGSEIWSEEIENELVASPAMAETVIYFSDQSGFVHAFDAASGEKQWQHKVSQEGAHAPVIADGSLYISDRAGQLHALHGLEIDSENNTTTDESNGDTTTDESNGDTTTDESNGDTTTDESNGDTTTDESNGDTTTDESNGDTTTDASNGDTTTDASEEDQASNGLMTTKNMLTGGGSLLTLLGGYALFRRTNNESSGSDQPISTETVDDQKATVLQENDPRNSQSLPSVDDLFEDIEQKIDDIERAKNSGAYEHALALCNQINETLETVHSSDRYADPGDDTKIESKINAIGDLKEEIKRQYETYQNASEQLKTVSDDLDRAAKHLNQNNPDETLNLLSEIEEKIDEIEEYIHDQDFPDVSQRIISYRERHKALHERAQRAQDAEIAAMVSTQVDESDMLLNEAKKARQANDYNQALDSCRQAIGTLDEIVHTARIETPNRVEGIENQLHEAEELLGEIESEAQAYEQTENKIESIKNSLDTAAESLDKNNFEKALNHLRGVSRSLTEVAEVIEEHKFRDLSKQIERLEESYNMLIDRAHRVPETIPTISDIPLEYDNITKEEEIGVGGNADVYRATVETPREMTIALKEPRMSGTLHTETVRRLLDEAETWQRLADHDYIVGIVDYDSDPLPWIAMEYMDAGHLGNRAGEMAFEQALWTAIVTTEAVRHAHRRGIAHLDLKPENILFRSVEDAWDVPKVADWGLSKQLLMHSKSIEGLSPHYAAPEQFNDSYGSTDDLTDVYQLGAVFYELFTGQPPFEGKPARVMNQVLNETPTPPSGVADVPDELNDILLTALAKEKENRYESVLYLRDELQNILNIS